MAFRDLVVRQYLHTGNGMLFKNNFDTRTHIHDNVLFFRQMAMKRWNTAAIDIFYELINHK
jgi:hypothetical protein